MPAARHPVVALLRERGETWADLARDVGVTRGTLRQALMGHTRPWPALRRRVAARFDLPESELFLPDHDDAVTA